MKNLYSFNWNCGRSGDVSSVFVATKEQIDELVGKNIYFDEILVKHSEIFGIVKSSDISKIDCIEGFAEEFEKIIGSIGYNPLDRYLDQKEDGDYD